MPRLWLNMPWGCSDVYLINCSPPIELHGMAIGCANKTGEGRLQARRLALSAMEIMEVLSPGCGKDGRETLKPMINMSMDLEMNQWKKWIWKLCKSEVILFLST